MAVPLLSRTSDKDDDEGEQNDEPGDPGGPGDPPVAPDADVEGGLPDLGNLHKQVPEYTDKNAKCVDGENPKFRFDALGNRYFPWKNQTEALLAVWVLKHRPSRKALQELLDLLTFVDAEGSTFDPRDVPTSSEHYILRMRERLPLLPVYERQIKDKNGEPSRAMDIPFNLQLQRMFSSPRVVEEWMKNLGGHRMTDSERAAENIPEELLSPVATRLVDGSLRVAHERGLH